MARREWWGTSGWLAALICAACSGTPRSRAVPAPPSHLAASVPALLAAVGARPRVLAIVDLRDPELRAWLGALAPILGTPPGRSPAECKLALDRLDSLRVAVGEPFRIAAEIDGRIDAEAVACVLGPDLSAELTAAGVAIRDRPGGVAIERDLEPARPAAGPGSELAARCGDRSACLVARLGPVARAVWLELSSDGTMLKLRLGGLGVETVRDVVAAIGAFGTTTPAARALAAREVGGALVLEIPWTVVAERGEELAAAVGAELLETVSVPPTSAMIPTLVRGDRVLTVKGPLRGPIFTGMVVLHRATNGKTYMKRVVARGGATVVETEHGIAIDGNPLVTEEVEGAYPYVYDFGAGAPIERSGKVVREHLPDRSYLTLRRLSASQAFARSKQRGAAGSWTVPSGQVFVLGDNRDDSTDSRYIGSIPEDAIVGRVAAIWFAMHEGVPDWDRMGSAVE